MTKATLDGKIFLYQYDQNGNLLQKQGGGITTQIAYNKANLPVSYQNGTLQSYAYTYALDGNRLTDSETVSQVQKSYQYTNRGELSAETVNGATTAYTYDSRGNRLTKTGADTATYLYDLANRMTKETHDTWYEDNYYDNAGNLTDVYHFYQNADNPDSYGMQFWWYRYNELNQLTSYHKNGDEWTYTYNVNGLRNSKQASHGDTATFTWNGGNMIREKDSVMENIYTYGVDGVAAQKNRLWDLVYQKNAHGNVIAVTDSSGNPIESYTYDAFGNQPSAVDAYRNFRYCGEYTDPETGFVYLRNRYYNPSTGRMISPDQYWSVNNAIGNKTEKHIYPNSNSIAQSCNKYVYCINNPLKYIDPSGQYILYSDKQGNVYAKIEKGDTLSKIALAEVNNSSAWKKMNYQGDPSKLQIGEYVNITGIYDKNHPKNIALSNSLPLHGKPNSRSTLRNPDGTPKQEREYGSQGEPIKDTDYNHGGNEQFPHEHEWHNGQRGPAQPIPQKSDIDIWGKISAGLVILGGLLYSAGQTISQYAIP